MSPRRALVIGGGIGGLAAGVGLARTGWQVEVFERSQTLRVAGGALTLWSNGVEAVERLGLGEAVRARAVPIERAELRAWDGGLLQSLAVGARARSQGRTHLLVDRGALLDALASALPDGALRYGVGCAAVRDRPAGAEALFDDGATREADVVVGADGLHSAVRASLLGAEAPRSAEQSAWVGCVRGGARELPLGTTVGVVGQGLRFWYAAMPDAVHWYAIVSHAAAQREALDDREGLLRLFRAWASPVRELVAATPAEAITRVEIRDRPPVARWSVGAATLAGDAAHPMTPDLGQGACQALEDAVALGAALAPPTSVAEGLARYEAVRLRRANAVAELSRLVASLSMPERREACALRDVAWRLTPPEVFLAQLDMVTHDGAGR